MQAAAAAATVAAARATAVRNPLLCQWRVVAPTLSAFVTDLGL
ncbi:hypothetical protein [Streptomyces cellostaticus]|nr:hypothetical protein [Streptomyces cellostaticus]